VKLRLDNQKPSLRLECRGNLSQESNSVWNLMDHVECEGKIHLLGYAYPFRLSFVQDDARAQSGMFALLPQDLQHLILDVHGDHLSVFAYHFGHSQGEHAGTAAQIQDRLALFDVFSNNLARIVDGSSDPIVEEPRTLRGTYPFRLVCRMIIS
jgi:hypothetical protein